MCQGDILRDIELVEWAQVIEGEPRKLDIQKKNWPYAVVVSQECDLHQDQTNRGQLNKPTQDKYLHSVLLCPGFLASDVKAGTHFKGLDLTCEYLNSERWNVVKDNKNDRYHFLPAHDAYQVPDMVLDFKHFTTAPRNILYDKLKPGAYIASLGQLFREHLSQRFAAFLARIALPDPEDEKPPSTNTA